MSYIHHSDENGWSGLVPNTTRILTRGTAKGYSFTRNIIDRRAMSLKKQNKK